MGVFYWSDCRSLFVIERLLTVKGAWPELSVCRPPLNSLEGGTTIECDLSQVSGTREYMIKIFMKMISSTGLPKALGDV